jgi:predicted PurR-regulated permease PerM
MADGPHHHDEFLRRTAVAVGFTALAVVVLFAMYVASGALLLVYVSVLLAIGFGPLVRAIEHQKRIPVGSRRLPRWLAILVVYLVILGVIAILGMLVIPPLVRQGGELWQQLPRFFARVQQFLMDRGLLDHQVTLGEAVRQAPDASGAAVGTAATAVAWTMTTLLGVITVLILTFYLLVESDALFAGFARLFKRENRPRVVEASRKISTKVSAWLSGQLILAGTIGASAAGFLYLLGVPYFYVLALIAAIGEMIPVVGPFLSAVPAILVALSVSPRTALYVAIFWLVQQQVENNLLVPKIMERQVGVSPVVVMVALLIGGSLLGIIGAVLAVPTAAILQVVIEELLDERDQRLESRDLNGTSMK